MVYSQVNNVRRCLWSAGIGKNVLKSSKMLSEILNVHISEHRGPRFTMSMTFGFLASRCHTQCINLF